MILDVRKTRLIDIANTTRISKERFEHNIGEYLDLQKLREKRVLGELVINRLVVSPFHATVKICMNFVKFIL